LYCVLTPCGESHDADGELSYLQRHDGKVGGACVVGWDLQTNQLRHFSWFPGANVFVSLSPSPSLSLLPHYPESPGQIVVYCRPRFHLLQPDHAVGEINLHEEVPEGCHMEGRSHTKPRLLGHAHCLHSPGRDGVWQDKVYVHF
ncbi:hypothetical protein EGW08_005029, partial [Elysia chlorotica]